MNAKPYLVEIGEALQRAALDAVLIGNAAAALQGAPVTTVDFDFLFRKTRRNLAKIRQVADALGASVLRPSYPAADMYRLVRDDGPQIHFMATIHGIRSFEGLRARADTVDLGRTSITIAALADIIKSKRAAHRRATPRCLRCWRKRLKKKGRRARLAAVRRESDRA